VKGEQLDLGDVDVRDHFFLLAFIVALVVHFSLPHKDAKAPKAQ
jgi:hypothetical protein